MLVFLDFDEDFLLTPTSPDEVLPFLVTGEPAIAFVVGRPLGFTSLERPANARLAATILKASMASSRVMFETAGGLLIVRYFLAGIVSIVGRGRAEVKKQGVLFS